MRQLRLVGPGPDGEHLIVATEDGEEFELPLGDDVRRAAATVRPRRAADSASEDDARSSLSPKEIQQRIRAGLNAAELAELTGEPVEALERYEAPVIAERAYIAELARATRIGRESGAPVLGDLVTDRLASRGVDPESVMWDAWREPDGPWLVCADFPADGRTVRALWEFDHTARAVTAQDDESRWLTETELLDVPIPKRHLSAVREQRALPLEESRPVMPTEPAEPVAPTPTELLLENLEERRGTRENVDPNDLNEDDDEAFEGFGPARQREADVSFTADARSGRSMPHPAGSARRTDGDEPDGGEQAESADAGEPRPQRKGRASVPSWDEIVFGAKHD